MVFRNVLHHIGNLKELTTAAADALKPGGLILADDGLPCGKREALIIGCLLMLLPTDIPYHHKLQRVLRKGNILRRTQGLVDPKDGSPFEGISGQESLEYINQRFSVSYFTTFAAFIGVLSSQVRMPKPPQDTLLACSKRYRSHSHQHSTSQRQYLLS